MKRRPLTTARAMMLLFGALVLSGVTACNDQLLPPAAGDDPAQTPKEPLLFFNNFGPLVDPDIGPDLAMSNIEAVRPDGTARRLITKGLISSTAQNGRIAYYDGDSDDGSQAGVYLANDDGTSPVLIWPATTGSGVSVNPWTITIGPDGRSAAWIDVDGFGMTSLHVYSPTINRTIQLGVSLTADSAAWSIPVFSPDGQWIAYQPAMNFLDPRFQPVSTIQIVSTGTGEATPLDIPIASTVTGIYAPPFDWSADSRRLLFVGWCTSPDVDFLLLTQLMTVDLATRDVDTLTSDEIFKDSPRWLPGGAQTVYVGLGEKGSDLYLREQSGQTRPLTFDDETMKMGLSVSSDGRTLLYSELPTYGPGLGTVRTFDLVTRRLGPVLATNTFLAFWRR